MTYNLRRRRLTPSCWGSMSLNLFQNRRVWLVKSKMLQIKRKSQIWYKWPVGANCKSATIQRQLAMCSGNCAQSSFLDKLTSALFRRQWLTESRLAPFCPAFVSPCANISPGLKGYYAVCCSVQCGNIVDVHFNAATVQCALKRRHQCGNIADVQLATRMWVQRQSSLRVLTALRNCF